MDNESLSQYMVGNDVSFEDIKRRLFLLSRSQNRLIPDHLYRLYQEKAFENVFNFSDIFLIGVKQLSENHLEVKDKRVYVKEEMQNSWQELLTYIPPLFLQSLIMYNEYIKVENKDLFFFKDLIFPNTKYTSIPSAKITQLEHLLNDNKGFHDLHMHLNGSLETDQIWQDYLSHPTLIYRDLKKSFSNSKVKEQIEQESSLLEPLIYINLLKDAQKIRHILYEYIFNPDSLKNDKNFRTNNINKLLSNQVAGYRHPFLDQISSDWDTPYLMSVESYMYVLILEKIMKSPNEVITKLLHYYLLILGLTNRLLVQQTHQNGFEQFQKNTLNGLREQSEKSYSRRYLQMHGNESKFLSFLEGRFSPKVTQLELITQIEAIYKGWNKMIKTLNLSLSENHLPQLKLIAHFIKKIDAKPNPYIRHKALRLEVAKKGRNISSLLKNYPKYKSKLIGIDAASSEFDAPPEVFAPTYRALRRKGIKHFTYHAGEDFYHILDGLRSIYEAIIFCNLTKTDRIGHATAAGISIKLWSEIIGKSILIKQGIHLDNLIFAYHLIVKSNAVQLQRLIPQIINEVNNLSFNIYNEYYPILILEQAWLMRECCPLHCFNEKNYLQAQGIFDDIENNWFLNRKIIKGYNSITNDKIIELYQKYHNMSIRKNYDKVISIDPFEMFDYNQLEILQLEILKFMTIHEIVIETLPTSNVRIGFHKNYSTYHLLNWINWNEQGYSIPPIVLGSDDTGIFATNIYNEFANLYCSLINDHKLSQSKAMKFIKKIDENSKIYKFK
ncbi:hypothetical protein CHA01nite_32500 [Chryseobacterium hagamense]|uniref:Adenosine deaminase domain-containing protein n=2 Tax=Chryseobacterium hagamense TaxID=395935 RepID=A0A511YQN9_9FLAO|nr:hypothetical protein CHA01nite_32500 [Chryseobacterium hagamense]